MDKVQFRKDTITMNKKVGRQVYSSIFNGPVPVVLVHPKQTHTYKQTKNRFSNLINRFPGVVSVNKISITMVSFITKEI